MVRVCDSIMGSGKTSAVITYLNEHPKDKFIYITPFLDEAARIRKGCPKLSFVEPSNKIEAYHFRKSEHTAALVKKGVNIATTHQSFKSYTKETLDCIKDGGYTLIIDENVETCERYDIQPDDIEMAQRAGYIELDNGEYSVTERGEAYGGGVFSELFGTLKSRKLIQMTEGEIKRLFYWVLPPELITSFKDVFILTYLFEGQSLHHIMKIYDIPFEYIGVEKGEDMVYRFVPHSGAMPDYVRRLPDMVHVLDNDKLNKIGDDYYALSMNWFNTHRDEAEQVKKNVYNYFSNLSRDVPADRKLWGSYNNEYGKLRGKGYSNSFLAFNARATNSYKDRDCLAYIANLFMNVGEKQFYKTHGLEVDEDMYALSVIVQWVWRSAIREGKEINLYIPSRRMREIFVKWIHDVSGGGIYEEG